MEKNRLKILLIEDHAGYPDLLRDILSEEINPSYEIESTSALKPGLQRLGKGHFDAILLDLSLHDSEGLHTFNLVHAKAPFTPIVILTGLDDQKLALEAIRNGAQDYLVKGRIDGKILASVIRFAIERKRSEMLLRKYNTQREQILASITSILIGLNPEGIITHWNPMAESTFGIPAIETVNKHLSQCGISWNLAYILDAMEECRKKNKPVRLDDVHYKRSDGQERILGFTLIPILESDAAPEFLLFGADITARKQIEQMKTEFVSTVSHEFRTPLAIIREGVSQVLDGVCGGINKSQEETLSLSLLAIDRLTRLVDGLLDISRIEAGRVELKKDLLDVVHIAGEIHKAFQGRARHKGLELKLRIPKDPISIYADRDKLIQIFTNLAGNALKFTEKGFVEIAVEGKGEAVECSVADTGKGIAKEDLNKIFGKFQQFSRTVGPGEKGTGLGLAICKGLVEAHEGKIWLESALEVGTRAVFALPKHTGVKVFKDYLNYQLKESVKNNAPVSVLVFGIENLSMVKQKSGADKLLIFMDLLERVIKKNLRRQADKAIRDDASVLVVLPATPKKDAASVAERILQMLNEEHEENSGEAGMKISYRCAGFPEDGNMERVLMNKVLRSGEKHG